jgi:hypothetical protein
LGRNSQPMKGLSHTARFVVMASAFTVGSFFLLRSVSPPPQALQVTFLYTTTDSAGTHAWLDIENRQHDPVSSPSPRIIFLEKRKPTWQLEKPMVLEMDPHVESFAPGTTMVSASLPPAPGRYRCFLVINSSDFSPAFYDNARGRLADFLARRNIIDYKTWHRMQGNTVIISEAFDVSADTPRKVQ